MKSAISLVILGALAGTQARAADPVITDLVPIALRSGVNEVSKLSPDGRDGLIVLGWRDNGNAHGYDLALVLLPSRPGNAWNVVRVDGGKPDVWGDGVTDAPHTGDDMVRAFRFARGRVNGRPATLLLIATRDQAGAIPDPSPATFEAYALEHKPDVGTTPDHFALVAKDRSPGPYCNADVALSRRFGLPLRGSFAGAKTADGCG